MSLKLRKNSFLQSLIVGLCDTQIGGFSPILTKKLTNKYFYKSVKKSADFFYQETSADFLVGAEIVWWDTSFSLTKARIICQYNDMCRGICLPMKSWKGPS